MVLLALFTTINAAIVTFEQDYNGFVIAFIVVAITLVVALGYIIYLLRRRRRAYRRITKESVLRVIRREGYYPKVDGEGDISFEVGDAIYMAWFDTPDLDKFIEWIFTKDKQIVARYNYTDVSDRTN